MNIEYLSLVRLGDIRAAGSMSHKMYGFILRMLNRTVMLIAAGNALWFFTGSRTVIPFSVDLSPFCRSFRIECNTKIKIYIDHDVFFANEVHNVTKRSKSLIF